MDNQVGSINFDANALYLEEESEHEDDKQQDNEIQALISQGGLDGILDDDSMLSSSADSSIDESDNSESHSANNKNNIYNHRNQQKQPHHHRLHHHQMHKLHQNNHENDDDEDNDEKHHLNEQDLEKYQMDQNNEINENHNPAMKISNDNDNDMSLFVQPQVPQSIIATPAHQLKQINGNIQTNQNYLLNHFSTPSNNQNPPPPQMLQATIIPTIQEDKIFYRQRNKLQVLEPNNKSPQQYAINETDNTMAQIGDKNGYDLENDMDNITQHNNQDINQFMNIQKQHYVPHSKLHSLERFSAPNNIMQATHHMASNNHEMTLNNVDNDDNEKGFRNSLEAKTNKVPIASFGNGVQLEFSTENNPNTNHETKQSQQQMNKYQETSLIDLNELDEAQLKQLQAEEEKQQQEYFNIEHLNRLYCQSQFLYKIRGKKLEEVTNRFAAYQEDMSRDIRAMKHRVALAEKEKESIQVSLNQVHELCTQYQNEAETAKKNSADIQDKFEKLKQNNRALEQKIADQEQEIENLHLQISEQQKLDTLERVNDQHERIVQQLRDQYEKDLYQMNHKLAETQKELNDKHDFIKVLTSQLDSATKSIELASIERNDIVNRMNKNLNDLQLKYNQDVVMIGLSNNNNKMNDDNKTKLIEQLTEKCRELESELKAITLKSSNDSNDSLDFHISNLSNTLNVLNANESATTGSMKSLQNELERALNQLRQKRTEIQNSKSEIERLKNELANRNQNVQMTSSNDSALKLEIERLNNLINELEREKIDLNNELSEKSAKLDQALETEEQYQQIKSNLELELFNKQQHIEECEKLIDQLHQELNQQQNLNPNSLNEQINEHLQSEKQKYQLILNDYEKEIGELKLNLANRDHDVLKCREMYLEVCKEKNNLQDTLKEQYDKEYEQQLKQKLDLAIANKLDEQKNLLNEKWSQERSQLISEYRKQIETNLNDLKSTREQILKVEKQYDQLRLEKANLELKSNRTETELKEKYSNLERLAKENEDKFKFESDLLKNDLEKIKLDLDNTKAKLNEKNQIFDSELNKSEANLIDLKSKYEKEKLTLMESIEKLTKEKEELVRKQIDLTDKLVVETQKSTDLDKKLSETSLNLRTKDIDLGKLKETQDKLNEMKLKLETETEKHKKEIENLYLAKTKELETKLNEENSKLNQLKSKLENELDKFKRSNEQLTKNLNDLNEKFEASKQSWNQEKSSIISKKDEELEKVILQLEKRFEEDYSKFLQTHKEAMHRALNEKTQEYAKEKEKLIEMYQTKYNEYETNEQNLSKQIKDLKERQQLTPPQVAKPKSDAKCQTDSNDNKAKDLNDEYINSLLDKIKALEEMISNTDAHFEIELNKLREELEEEYHLKLKEELENKVVQERANLTMNSDVSSSLNEVEFDQSVTNKVNIRAKYSKLKQDMSIKEREFESVEQAYRIKLEQLQEKFQDHLKKMQQKYESELQHAKQELSDRHKQTLIKSKNEIDQMQLFVQKLKKANLDSDKVIESLKHEMKKMKENHLDELTTLKINSEREKETLRESYEQSIKKISLLEKQLDENEDRLKKELETLRAELRSEHNIEMTKMNSKMKDMMKSHSSAVDLLKKQHQTVNRQMSVQTKHLSCQTDISFKDIDLLETFRQKYLETLTRMKSDMIKEFEAQTLRISERVSREINQERSLIKEKINAILFPKINELLKEFRVSETMIRVKMDELEKDLIQIMLGTDSKKPVSYSSQLISSMRSSEGEKLNKIDENYVQTTKDSQSTAKRSVSALTSSIRPNSAYSDHIQTNTLYSKSTSSMRDIQPLSGSVNSILNSFKNDSKEIDLKQVDHQQSQSNKSNGCITLGTGYKYTPLRQSWSNLSQMNTLSPYSLSNLDSPVNKKLISEETNINSEFKSQLIETSPSIPRSKRYVTMSRPQTADSALSKEIENINEKKSDEDLYDEDKDYIYVDDNIEDNLNNDEDDTNKNTFFKKYRTQNIRQKKAQKLQQQNNKQIPVQRPHSASNLLRSTSNFIPSQSTSKQIDQKNQILTRSNTNVNTESVNRRQLSSDIMKPKTTLSIYKDKTSLSKQSLYENEADEAPIRLCSDSDDMLSESSKVSSKCSQPTLRSASSVINGSTRSGSSLGIKTGNSSNTSAFSSNSLPRSRTPNGSSITSDLMGSTHSYRSATLSSINKSAHSSTENVQLSSSSTLSTNLNSNIQNSISVASTQYHPINNNLASNLVKNSAFQPQSKKKTVFY